MTINIADAARIMSRLNHIAHDVPQSDRHRIYALKTELIARLYGEGYCVAVRQDTRRMACACQLRHAVNGCDQCQYTGQRDVILYRFCFDIGGEHYVWHQPERQVAWPIRLTGDVPDGWHRAAQHKPLQLEDVPVFVDALTQWVRAEREG